MMVLGSPLAHGVLAHAGHDHSRGASEDKDDEQTETEPTEDQEVPAAQESAVQEAVQEPQVVVNESGLFERLSQEISLGVGESAFNVLMVQPFLLIGARLWGPLKKN